MNFRYLNILIILLFIAQNNFFLTSNSGLKSYLIEEAQFLLQEIKKRTEEEGEFCSWDSLFTNAYYIASSEDFAVVYNENVEVKSQVVKKELVKIHSESWWKRMFK